MIPPSCPWDSWRQAPLDFCEEVLHGWVKQPANTWSNIGFIVVGIWIWRLARREGRLHLRTIAVVALVIGFGSTFYHASGTYWGSLADYAGTFMASGVMVALNVRRWLRWSWAPVYLVFAGITLFFLGSMVAFPGSERWLFTFGSPCWIIELRLFFRDRRVTRYRMYLVSYIVLAVATLFWWLDVARILCIPNNHILTGHSVWHLLMAAVFLPLYRFYAQFSILADVPAASAGARTAA
ncbi:MAG: ceramidase domain-containing protein [Planctomycetes bacterium]|nr:ceramidase domain-containing protein [Planctomycetota bacterium]